MTWTTRILAILNVLAAFVLFYAAAQSYTARNAWARHLELLRERRDGVSTGKWFEKLPDAQLNLLADRIELTPELIERMPAGIQEKLKSLEARKQAAGIRGYRQKSELQQRTEAGRVTYDPRDPRADPGKLRLNQGEIADLARDLGPVGFTHLIREAILLSKPKLIAQERELAETKASLLRLRARINDDIERLRADVEHLNNRRAAEEFLRDRLTYENTERRRELSRLYVELEEAQHAADVALGREADAWNQLAEVGARSASREQPNRALEERLVQTESATAGSSPR